MHILPNRILILCSATLLLLKSARNSPKRRLHLQYSHECIWGWFMYIATNSNAFRCSHSSHLWSLNYFHHLSNDDRKRHRIGVGLGRVVKRNIIETGKKVWCIPESQTSCTNWAKIKTFRVELYKYYRFSCWECGFLSVQALSENSLQFDPSSPLLSSRPSTPTTNVNRVS